MSIAKKIILGGLEAVGESVRQVVKPLDPFEAIDTAIHPDKGSDVTKYLQDVGDPELQGDALKKKQMEEEKRKQEALAKHRAFLKSLEAGNVQSVRAGEQTAKDLEDKRLRESQQKPQQFADAGMGRKKRRLGMPQQQKARTSVESKQNMRTG